MDAVLIFFARYLIILVPLALLQLLWVLPQKERIRFVSLTIFSLLLAYMLAKIGTQLVNNPRPFEIGNFTPLVPHGIENGFPSMHTLVSATVAVLVFTKRRSIGIVLFVFAICIGIARVLAGVHHGVDVLAALGISIVAVWLARQLLSIRVYR